MSNHSYVLTQLVKLSKSATRCKSVKIATCVPSDAMRYKLLIINITPSRQLAHSPDGSDTFSDCNVTPLRPPRKKTFKKYAPTPIARELFPNFISDVGEVSRPELFEQFCVPIKNSWLLFSWNYLRKSKNWMSFEDLECGVRRPANLHLPLKSYVGHWVINIF